MDVIFVKTAKELSPFLLKLSLSDHYLVGLSTFLNYHKDPQTHFYGRSYRKYTFDIARSYYNAINLSKIFQYNNVNLVWNTLKDYIFKCASKLCPVIRITTKVNQPKWITNDIVKLLNDRDKAFLKAILTKSPSDLKEAKILRHQAKQAVRTARAAHIRETLAQTSDDPRKFWRELNTLIKQKASNSLIRLKDESNVPIDHADTPNYINNYFSTIGPKLAEQFNTAPHSPPASSPPPQPLPNTPLSSNYD